MKQKKNTKGTQIGPHKVDSTLKKQVLLNKQTKKISVW